MSYPFFAGTLVALLVAPIHAEPKTTELSLKSLQKMRTCELEALYRAGTIFEPKQGFHEARAFPKPDSQFPVWRSELLNLVWKGKHLYPEQGFMLNQVGKKQIVAAEISKDVSWLDGKPSVIFDYANGPKWASKARDEVRQIAPGLYLGVMYLRDCPCPKQKMYFALQECTCN